MFCYKNNDKENIISNNTNNYFDLSSSTPPKKSRRLTGILNGTNGNNTRSNNDDDDDNAASVGKSLIELLENQEKRLEKNSFFFGAKSLQLRFRNAQTLLPYADHCHPILFKQVPKNSRLFDEKIPRFRRFPSFREQRKKTRKKKRHQRGPSEKKAASAA